MNVCLVDGVEVVESRSGKMIHVDAIPQGVNPDHIVGAIPAELYGRRQDTRTDLRAAAEDMYVHHRSLHPLADCLFLQSLERALNA